MVCKVKIHPRPPGLMAEGGSGNNSYGTPHSHGYGGEYVEVSGCENHQVILSEYDMNKAGGQNTMVFQNGTHWLHHLHGRVSVAEVNKVPIDTKAVGFQNMYYISDYGVKNGMHQLFHGSWQPEQGQFYNQGQLCPNGGEVWPLGMHNEYGGSHTNGFGPNGPRYACVYPKNAQTLRNVDASTSTGSSTLSARCTKIWLLVIVRIPTTYLKIRVEARVWKEVLG